MPFLANATQWQHKPDQSFMTSCHHKALGQQWAAICLGFETEIRGGVRLIRAGKEGGEGGRAVSSLRRMSMVHVLGYI